MVFAVKFITATPKTSWKVNKCNFHSLLSFLYVCFLIMKYLFIWFERTFYNCSYLYIYLDMHNYKTLQHVTCLVCRITTSQIPSCMKFPPYDSSILSCYPCVQRSTTCLILKNSQHLVVPCTVVTDCYTCVFWKYLMYLNEPKQNPVVVVCLFTEGWLYTDSLGRPQHLRVC